MDYGGGGLQNRRRGGDGGWKAKFYPYEMGVGQKNNANVGNILQVGCK